jgi:hypothetical protein
MFDLPELRVSECIIDVDMPPQPGFLFHTDHNFGLSERRRARRFSIEARCRHIAEVVNASSEPWLIWCGLNEEGTLLDELIPDAVEVAGRHDREIKVERMLGFSSGKYRVLVTKPKIAGFGMNWQHCARVAFCGLSDSYEQFYQAIRRCWRYGQKRPVEGTVVISRPEMPVLANVRRKARDADTLRAEVAALTRDGTTRALQGERFVTATYERDVRREDGWTMHLGDCVEVMRDLPDHSIGYSVFSPPFASLYTYSDLIHDMGNCTNHDEFFEHFKFLVPELLRVTKPGRLLSFHCMLLPTVKVRDGVIGLRDFRGELIRLFMEAGWIFHSEVVIWKDPVTAMQRTKALGLLHKQLKKDSCMSRQGIPDYVVTMRKPGENPEPVSHTNESFPVREWQEYASPVWSDINPNETLQHRSAREHEDERHICPLQLEVIRRCLRLWSRPGDVVLSPFAGIGSEGYEAIRADRQFIGIELKRSYFTQACKNLAAAVRKTGTLFAETEDHDDEPDGSDGRASDVPRREELASVSPHQGSQCGDRD